MISKIFNRPKIKMPSHIKNMAQIIILGYVILILTGTLLLCLPGARVDHESLFFDSLFTSTSAVSVTGLTICDTATTYTLFGQIVILALIQIGGVGYMTLAVTMFIIMGKNIGLEERLQLKESQGVTQLQGIKNLTKNMVKYALSIEAIGIILLWIYFAFDPKINGYFSFHFAVFHAISAFCNAGFDVLGKVFTPDCGIAPYNTEPFVLLTIAFLSILGSFGYVAFKDLIIPERKRKRSTQTKIVFTTTISLLALGTIIFFFSEATHTMKDMSCGYKLLNSFYLSATARSTGLGNVNIGELGIIAYWVLFLLEVIGGSPSGTGGGIKTTTFAILVASVKSALTKENDTVIFGRRIHHRYVNRAISIIVLYLLITLIAVIIIGLFEPEAVKNSTEALRLQLDVFSALGTAGLSNNMHREFHTVGLSVMIALMFIGRVGALTLFNTLVFNNKKVLKRYPADDVTIG